jgi:hypothetical protein
MDVVLLFPYLNRGRAVVCGVGHCVLPDEVFSVSSDRTFFPVHIINTHTHRHMPRSYTRRCQRGSFTRFHAPTGTCKKPCKTSHGKDHRRSPKSPHHCIKTASGTKKKKMDSAAKIIAAWHKYSAKKKAASSSSPRPHFATINAGIKNVRVGHKFTTNTGTYKKVSKSQSASQYIKLKRT